MGGIVRYSYNRKGWCGMKRYTVKSLAAKLAPYANMGDAEGKKQVYNLATWMISNLSTEEIDRRLKAFAGQYPRMKP